REVGDVADVPLQVERGLRHDSVILPAVGAVQLHEAAVAEVVLDQSLLAAPQADQRLHVMLPDREYQAAVRSELDDQGSGNLRRTRRDDDAIVRRLRR